MASKSTADRAVWVAYDEEPDNRVPLARIVVCSSEIAARRVAMNMMDDGAAVRVPFGDSILDAILAKSETAHQKNEEES